MKERLSKSYKLSDLQARLAKVKDCADQVKRQNPAADVANLSKVNTRTPTLNVVET